MIAKEDIKLTSEQTAALLKLKDASVLDRVEPVASKLPALITCQNIYEDFIEKPVNDQHRALMVAPLAEAASVLKQYHSKMDLVLSGGEPVKGEGPHQVEFEEAFKKVDEIRDSLRQPRASEACPVLLRYLATLHEYDGHMLYESIEQQMSK